MTVAAGGPAILLPPRAQLFNRSCSNKHTHTALSVSALSLSQREITCSFPCGKWLHKIGVRTSPGWEFCKRERRKDMASLAALPEETVAHIQSAGCKAQKKSVIGAHNRCWGYLRSAISTHGEAKRNLEFIEGDQDRQLKQLWAETGICDILGGY